MSTLRSYPHRPDAGVMQRARESSQKLAVSLSTATPDFLANRSGLGRMVIVESWLDMARTAYGLQEDDAEVVLYLRESSDFFAWAAAEGAEFDLRDLSEQFSMALVLGAEDRARALGDLPPERHVVEGVTHPESAEREFEIFADLAAGREAQAAARMSEALATLERSRLRQKLQAYFASALDAMAGILARDQAGLTRALQRRHAAYAGVCTHPNLVDDPRSLIDLNGLALCALARRAGLTPWNGSVYMPPSLLQD